jgi:hypothetical protein
MRLGLALLLMALSHPTAQAACVVNERATIKLTVVDSVVMVTAQVNEQPATFILDTGAQRTVITRDAVTRIGLALDEWVATTTRGVGGIERHRNANPRAFTLGGVKLERRTRTRDTSMTVGTLPLTRIGPHQIDGLLGRDFLSPFDLVLDLRRQRVVLYEVGDCSGRFLPWHGGYRALPVENPTDTALVIWLELDGVRLRALLDTGASATVLAAPGMARLGLTAEKLAGGQTGQASGLGPRPITTVRHVFREMRIGQEVFREPALIVSPIRLVPIVDMLLGADWLANKTVWVSFATRQVFVAD